jgi:lysophospholipase
MNRRRRTIYVSLFSVFTCALGAGTSVTDYAPAMNQPCPAELVRSFTPSNQTLSTFEDTYVRSRLAQVIPGAYEAWVGDGSGIGYNISAFNNNFSRIGIAVSGGGFRAAQYGAGIVAGLDARNDSAKASGTGGMLQVASYFIGLSGALHSRYSAAPSSADLGLLFALTLLRRRIVGHGLTVCE